MIRRVGAQIALLTFGVTILVGILAGNSPTTIMFRALVAMAGAFAVGQLIAWVAKLILCEYLQRQKLDIDRAHFEAVRALEAEAEAEVATPVEAG